MLKAGLCAIALSLSAAMTLSSCTYTAAVSQTNIPSDRSSPVEASVYKFQVLGLNFDNDEVYQLVGKLKDKCPNGEVRGILTKDLRTLYFLVFFWARETIASGYCVKSRNLAEADSLDADPSTQAALPTDSLESDAEQADPHVQSE